MGSIYIVYDIYKSNIESKKQNNSTWQYAISLFTVYQLKMFSLWGTI